MTSQTITLGIVFLAAAAVWSVHAHTPLLSVTYEEHKIGNETTYGLAVRRWHLSKNEVGEPIAFLRGKWHANGANKCTYDAQNEILYVFTHDDGRYGPKTAEITGVTVNHLVNTVVKRLPPAPACTASNFVNFDPATGDILHSCIVGNNYSINEVDTKSGAATELRTIPIGGSEIFSSTSPGYDEYNQKLAMTFMSDDYHTAKMVSRHICHYFTFFIPVADTYRR